MDFIRDNWALVIIAIAVVLALAFLLLRPRQRVQLTESTPVRPHMAYAKLPEGRGLAGEQAAAVSDVAGQLFGAPVRRELDGSAHKEGDDLCLIKGVGPKFEDKLNALGFRWFEQLAHLTPTEIERIDPQLGAFRGRIARDRIVEQADYLARNDIDGYEQRFGKLSA